MIPTQQEIDAADNEGPSHSPELDARMLAEALRIVQRETRLRAPQLCDLMGIDKNAFYRIRRGNASNVRITQEYLWIRLAEIRADFQNGN